MTLLSVGHRPELEAFHTRKIELERRRGGAKLVRDVELIEPAHRVLWRCLRRFGEHRPARARSAQNCERTRGPPTSPATSARSTAAAAARSHCASSEAGSHMVLRTRGTAVGSRFSSAVA